jgi:hypothetical protein
MKQLSVLRVTHGESVVLREDRVRNEAFAFAALEERLLSNDNPMHGVHRDASLL